MRSPVSTAHAIPLTLSIPTELCHSLVPQQLRLTLAYLTVMSALLNPLSPTLVTHIVLLLSNFLFTGLDILLTQIHGNPGHLYELTPSSITIFVPTISTISFPTLLGHEKHNLCVLPRIFRAGRRVVL